MPEPSKYVGAPVRRVEDPRFLLGRARYVADIALPHMAEMALLRSPHAHARIKSIDTDSARSLPGVLAVFTGAEVRTTIRPVRVEMNPEKNPGHKPSDWYALTWDKVRHVGDPVAAVVAENRYIAEDATELIAVDYEPLPPVVDPQQALADRTTLVHDQWDDNVLQQSDYTAGDPVAALAEAHLVIRERFRTSRHHAVSLEARACLATFDAATKDLTLWTSNQMPHFVRTILADLLQHPENRTRVIAPDVGGGFGLKSSFYLEDALTAFAAMQLRRPVRWLEDRYESFVASIHCKDEIVEAELGFAADGQLRAARLRVIADAGAYDTLPHSSGFEAVHTAFTFPGPYRFQDYAYSATAVTTNKTALSTVRGVGTPIACFVMERLLDQAARRLAIDPVDIRRRNLIRREEFPYHAATGLEYEAGGYHECLEKAIDIADYAAFRREQGQLRARGIHRGIGIACYNKTSGLGSVNLRNAGVPISAYESANIKFDPSGHVTVFCGTHSQGQSHETAFAQIAADELGVPLDRITVRLGDTADTPYGWGAWASRSAVSGGGAVLTTAQRLAAKIRRIAGHMLEVAAEDIELGDGRAQVKGAPARAITIAELAKRAIFTDASQLPAGEQPGLEATYYYDTPPSTFPNATHVAIVQVEPDTGVITILRYVAVEDCGRIINPMVVDGQICGGIAQGLGGALLEHLLYDEGGQLQTTSFMDYLLPTAADVPVMEIAHVETPSPLVAGGFKGAGEGGAIAPFAAIANAVADALAPFEPRVTQLPLTPERVYRLAHASPPTS